MVTSIRCVLMRAGSSRGPFFLADWLPVDIRERDKVLISAIGASPISQVDGLGGGNTLTSKVAIVSRSSVADCDVDYLFAQVGVNEQIVDTRPNCGNMLAGVGPFAIEQGLIKANDDVTAVRIFNVNTGAKITAQVQTPGGRVSYEGDTRLDGVPGQAAPIPLSFMDAWGAVTGKVFPTGNRRDVIDGVEVTCIDAAMQMVLIPADSLAIAGDESPAQLDANTTLMKQLESLRLKAGAMMGLGDVSQSVIPKPVILSARREADAITSRYFTPRRCHTSHAVTGAVGVASAFVLPGTVACDSPSHAGTRVISVHHPSGRIQVQVEVEGDGERLAIRSASVLRSARKIMEGELFIPGYANTL